MRLTASITHEGDWYVAQCLEIDVASQGESIEQAIANLKEALELHLEGEPTAKLRTAPIIAPIDVNIGGAAA
jgi:predicted RNase H-like HicB family nuclease